MQPMLPDTERVLRRLRIVRRIAWIDVCLLIALVAASLTGNRELVHILGPIHGGDFLLLLTVIGTAAADGLWSWWFLFGVFITGGPIGAFIGEWMIARRLSTQPRLDEQERAL